MEGRAVRVQMTMVSEMTALVDGNAFVKAG